MRSTQRVLCFWGYSFFWGIERTCLSIFWGTIWISGGRQGHNLLRTETPASFLRFSLFCLTIAIVKYCKSCHRFKTMLQVIMWSSCSDRSGTMYRLLLRGVKGFFFLRSHYTCILTFAVVGLHLKVMFQAWQRAKLLAWAGNANIHTVRFVSPCSRMQKGTLLFALSSPIWTEKRNIVDGVSCISRMPIEIMPPIHDGLTGAIVFQERVSQLLRLVLLALATVIRRSEYVWRCCVCNSHTRLISMCSLASGGPAQECTSALLTWNIMVA